MECVKKERTHCPECAAPVEPFWNYCSRCSAQLKEEVKILSPQQVEALCTKSQNHNSGNK